MKTQHFFELKDYFCFNNSCLDHSTLVLIIVEGQTSWYLIYYYPFLISMSNCITGVPFLHIPLIHVRHKIPQFLPQERGSYRHDQRVCAPPTLPDTLSPAPPPAVSPPQQGWRQQEDSGSWFVPAAAPHSGALHWPSAAVSQVTPWLLLLCQCGWPGEEDVYCGWEVRGYIM